MTDFLASGEAPVYIGFGSMPDSKPQKTTETIIEAVQRAGKRAIILIGWAGLGASDVPETIHILKYAPHTYRMRFKPSPKMMNFVKTPKH